MTSARPLFRAPLMISVILFASSARGDSDIAGEGKTLPEHVFRVRLPFRSAAGSSGFSPTGERRDSGMKLKTLSTAVVLEYGVTPAVSLQMVVPAILENGLSMDGNAFRNSFRFKQKYDEFIAAAVARLVDDRLCAKAAACADAIENNGLSLPASSELVLPTGEALFVRAGVPLKDVATALVTRAALPADGRVGAGDLEFGTLVALAHPEAGLWRKDLPVNMSLGLGLRIPTGSFSDVAAAQRGTGRGTWDLGVRTNLDWHLHPQRVVSVQNQIEQMIAAGRKKRSSLLNSSALNVADPFVIGADQTPNDGVFKRLGVRSLGFVKVTQGAGEFFESLRPLNVSLQWKYDFDPATGVEGRQETPAGVYHGAQAGMTFDGLRIGLPVQLDIEYEWPLAGENRFLTPVAMTTVLKGYHRF